jgi:hypothetical protein
VKVDKLSHVNMSKLPLCLSTSCLFLLCPVRRARRAPDARSQDDQNFQHELMAVCEGGPSAAMAEPRSSTAGHHLSECDALAPQAAVPARPAYVDALVEAVMAQDVLSVLLALRVLCAKGLLYSGKTGVDAKRKSAPRFRRRTSLRTDVFFARKSDSTLGVSALELQMRQADSPNGQAILQLLFLNLDGCLKWKPVDGPLYHHGSPKKWARAALQAFREDKGRSSTLPGCLCAFPLYELTETLAHTERHPWTESLARNRRHRTEMSTPGERA